MSIYRFTIPERLDGLNNYISACRTNPYQGAKLKAENDRICKTYIQLQLRGVQINGQAYMRYSWYEKDQRRDLDNISSFGRKVIQDALVECGVLKNDGWKQIVGFSDSFCVDKENPRIEVEIEER